MNNPFRLSLLCTGIILINHLTIENAYAEVVDKALDIPSFNTMFVTATRTPVDLNNTLASATVIERSDIEKLQPTDITDLLRQVPGAIVSRAGGAGSQSSLFLRGTNDSHTLILLNGQRISSATLGSTSFQFLDPKQIDRIEVVRGPRSSLYGSDAIGGVVQIFTRTAGSNPSAYASTGYGDHDSYRSSAGGSGQWENLRFAGDISQYSTAGFSNLEDKRPLNNDHDGYRNNSFNGALGYDFDNGAKLDLTHFYTSSKNEFDIFSAPSLPFSRNWIQNTQLKLDVTPTFFWHSTVSVGRSIDDSDNFDKTDPGGRASFRTTRNSATWQNDFALSQDQVLTAGADFYRDLIDSSTTYTDSNGNSIDSRNTTGYFAQYQLTQGLVDLQIGARRDKIERFGNETTGNISIGFQLPANHRAILSWGKAFKAPTLNDLYWPIGTYDYGNPNLKAESSNNYELELRGDYKPLRWSWSVYENKIDNLIEWAPDPASMVGAWTPSNVASTTIRGSDINVSTELAQWHINGRFSYTNPRDDETHNVLQLRNRRTFGLDADRQFGKLAIGASWLAQDFRYANQTNTHKISGYGVVDMRASYDFTANWQAAIRLNNVLNKEYATKSTPYKDWMSGSTTWHDYNTERAGWFATVTYRL